MDLTEWLKFTLRAQDAANHQAQTPQQNEAAAEQPAPTPTAQPQQNGPEPAQQPGGCDTRLSSRQQQLHPKTATLEAAATSKAAAMEQAQRATKEERLRLIEASRSEVPSDEQPGSDV